MSITHDTSHGKSTAPAFSAEALKKDLQVIKTRKFWIELLIITAGMFVASLGVYFFLIPSKLIIGSITGLSLVIAKLMPFLSVGTVIFVINAILLVLSFLLIGKDFGAKTVYSALILGPMIDLLGVAFPEMGTHSMFSTYIEGTGQEIANPCFDLLCFVLILSASQSILFSINASTGGLDILAKIINKYMHISLGTSVIISGGAICLTAILINPVQLVVIGLVGTWLNGVILNYFMASINSKIRVFIITDEHEKVQDYLVNHIKRGISLHEVIGGYSGKTHMQIESVLSKDDFSKLIDYMSKEDIASFMTSDEVANVYGLWKKKKFLRLSSR